MIEIRREDLTSETAQALIGALNAELCMRYPGDGGVEYFRLDPDEVRAGRGAFLVAYDADKPVGCGAVRVIERGIAEIKRMYVLPDRRGHGIARLVLAALEDEARLLGVARLLLETGTRQPEAIALYSNAGFFPTDPFGEYPPSPLNVFFEKRL
ncbi:MAG TPA: GNAT family N-acetyltransferase [Vicinamibacterales bacterium]